MGSCSSEPETTTHVLLDCQNHKLNRSKLTKKCIQPRSNNNSTKLWRWQIHTLLYSSQKFNFDLNKEVIKLTVCYPKDTERFDGSLIWNIHIFKIVSWRWYLTYIHSNLGSPLFGLSGVWVFFESLYIPYIYSAFLFCFVIYIYVFSTSSGLAEKRNRFPQGFSLVLHLHFRIFVFVLLNCESL